MKITILTLFPEMFDGPFRESIVKKAIERDFVTIQFLNIRDFGLGTHKVVDDTSYGGGAGMILRIDVLHSAIKAARDQSLQKDEEKVLLMTADGEVYNQRKAESYAKLKHLIIICGHYEGVDERVRNYIDEEVSIGDFVLTGGEIPAMLITDSVIRLIPGVLKEGVTDAESHSLTHNGQKYLEYPLYTRPAEYEGEKVPEVLTSGDHKRIEKWRKEEALKKTRKHRPDLLKKE